MEDLAKDLILQEHKYHMERIGAVQDQRTGLIRLSLGGTTAFYALLLSPRFGLPGSEAYDTLKYLPVALNIFGLLLAIGIRRSIRRRAAYIRHIEAQCLPEGLGWERFVRAEGLVHRYLNDEDEQRFRPLPMTVSNYIFWIFAIAATAALSVSI